MAKMLGPAIFMTLALGYVGYDIAKNGLMPKTATVDGVQYRMTSDRYEGTVVSRFPNIVSGDRIVDTNKDGIADVFRMTTFAPGSRAPIPISIPATADQSNLFSRVMDKYKSGETQ